MISITHTCRSDSMIYIKQIEKLVIKTQSNPVPAATGEFKTNTERIIRLNHISSQILKKLFHMKKMVFLGALRFVTLFSQQSGTFCISAVMHLNILLLSFPF